MALPWKVLERADTPEGALELRRRGEDEFLLTIGARVLMNSRANRSEIALARLGCEHLSAAPRPAVLIGGLGLGCTLRAALDLLPADARVVVAEIDPVVVRWYRTHLAARRGHALEDPRVEVRVEDVAETVARAAGRGGAGQFDAILFDLYCGPRPTAISAADPLYGPRMLHRVHAALSDRGVFAVWAEQVSPAFEATLRGCGYAFRRRRVGTGARLHVVYVAEPGANPNRRG